MEGIRRAARFDMIPQLAVVAISQDLFISCDLLQRYLVSRSVINQSSGFGSIEGLFGRSISGCA